MSSPYNSIETEIENVIATWLQGCIDIGACSFTDYGCLKTGLDEESLEENRIVISVVSAAELFAQSGIWNTEVRLIVYTNMDSTNALTNHRSNVGILRDTVMESNLVNSLNSSTSEVLFSGVGTYRADNQIEERSAVGGLTFNLIASGA